MPTRITTGRPMDKWCRDCEQFKPNPKDKKNPMYCEYCLRARFLKGLKKRKEKYERNL